MVERIAGESVGKGWIEAAGGEPPCKEFGQCGEVRSRRGIDDWHRQEHAGCPGRALHGSRRPQQQSLAETEGCGALGRGNHSRVLAFGEHDGGRRLHLGGPRLQSFEGVARLGHRWEL